MGHPSKYFILPLALTVMILAGCSGDANEPDASGVKEVPSFTATIGGVESRAIDRQWESGDEIGISGANRMNVRHHTPDGRGNFSVKTPGDQIYFQDEAPVTFNAYYPWNPLAGGTSSITADTRLQASQKSFDFLWAQATGRKSAPTVTFSFTHRMAKVVFTLKPGDDMSYDEIKAARVSLEGVRHAGTFNIADGTTATTGNPGGAWALTDFARFDDAARTVTYSLIFFPQRFDNPPVFSAQLNANSLNIMADIDFTGANRGPDGAAARNEWVAGRQYNLSLTLHKTEVTAGECVINSWNSVNGDDIVVD